MGGPTAPLRTHMKTKKKEGMKGEKSKPFLNNEKV